MASTPPLGKFLASTDKKTRDKAIKSLSTFLSSSKDALPTPEMAKLWKGIFYCFWMSDKPLVQQALASELAELLLLIERTELALAFLRGFWETTVREWNGIDRLRMDKYYMLVRRFANASFRLLLRSGWDASAVSEYHYILSCQGGPLCPSDPRIPTSLTYHLADIYLEELEKALEASSADFADKTPPAPLMTLIQPFLAIAAHTPNKTTYKHVQSAVFEPLFEDLHIAAAPGPSALIVDVTAASDRDDEGDADGEGRDRKRARLAEQGLSFERICHHCMLDERDSDAESRAGPPEAEEPGSLRRMLLKRLFEVASAPGTRDANRRKMYAFWKLAREDDEDEDESGDDRPRQ